MLSQHLYLAGNQATSIPPTASPRWSHTQRTGSRTLSYRNSYETRTFAARGYCKYR